MSSTFTHPKPEWQNAYDTVVEKLQTDETFLDFTDRLLKLTPGQYTALYRFVKYMPEKDLDGKIEPSDEDSKYALKL